MSKEIRFTEVIKANEGLIYKVTSMYTRSNVDQQDLYQEIVSQLWESFDRFRNESKISTWIYRIALNTAITSLRKSKKKGQEIPIDRTMLDYAEVSDPVLEERVKTLYSHIEMLGDLDKGIMLLYLEQKTHEEIADIIGLSTSNIGTRLSRIRNKLKEKMVKS